jgi:hypothetical protein
MNLDPIQKYLARVKAAQTSRSNNVRMTMEEAQELANSIAELLLARISGGGRDDSVQVISVDGGGFKK